MKAHLPGVLSTIAEVAGEAAALKLAQRLGGCELKVSGRKGGKLARIVGDEAAKAIAEALGPEKITVPMAGLRGEGGRRAAAAKMLEEGATETQVALACDIHTRTARRVRRRLKQDDLPLFRK